MGIPNALSGSDAALQEHILFLVEALAETAQCDSAADLGFLQDLRRPFIQQPRADAVIVRLAEIEMLALCAVGFDGGGLVADVDGLAEVVGFRLCSVRLKVLPEVGRRQFRGRLSLNDP